METLRLPDRYERYAADTQPAVPIRSYRNTELRNPARAPIHRPYTRTEITGPVDLATKLQPGDDNLASLQPGRMALGQLIHVSGRVLDEEGRPVRGAVVELWQANAAGRYLNPLDQRDAPLDPNFIGNGRTRTDDEGHYGFFTIKPGAYPVPGTGGGWWRPPHIHFSVLGPSSLSRLVTQMYFPGEWLNAHDRLIGSIADPAAQSRLVADPVPTEQIDGEWLGFRHSLILRGRSATPALP